LFSLIVFLRLYLLGRTIMLYSPAFRNVVLRSFGYMNHVSINISFLLKSYLEQWPTRCLATFLILFFFIGSWSLRACNYRPDNEHISMPDAMWLFIITATTVGRILCLRKISSFPSISRLRRSISIDILWTRLDILDLSFLLFKKYLFFSIFYSCSCNCCIDRSSTSSSLNCNFVE